MTDPAENSGAVASTSGTSSSAASSAEAGRSGILRNASAGRRAPSQPSHGLVDADAAQQQKRVQVVGAPPPFHGPPQTNGASREDHSEGEEGEEEDEEDGEDGRANGHVHIDDEEEEEDIPDSALLARFPDDEEVIDMTHLRIDAKALRRMGLSRFRRLARLSLRQNEISKISSRDVGALPELQDLDLYDNALDKTYGEVLKGCPNLESVDLSFNAIKHISHLAHLANVRTLYLVQNKISRVRPGDLDAPLGLSLRSLELGGNRLRSLENIGHLTNLEELWVGKNKITKLENLASLKKLRVLSIQSNRLVKIEGLEQLEDLEELYLSHNGLHRLEGLDSNTKLTTLDIGANKVSQIENVAHLKHLQEFWANENQITSLADLEAQLGASHCPELETVYLEGNPVQKMEGAAYRRKIRLALPHIKQIDAT